MNKKRREKEEDKEEKEPQEKKNNQKDKKMRKELKIPRSRKPAGATNTNKLGTHTIEIFHRRRKPAGA